jgi:hypothetical protein
VQGNGEGFRPRSAQHTHKENVQCNRFFFVLLTFDHLLLLAVVVLTNVRMMLST